MTAPDSILKLVEQFQLHLKSYKSIEYNETQARRRLAAAQTPAEKTRLQRQVDATDAQIDGLVYALYGLTEEEVGVVEGR